MELYPCFWLLSLCEEWFATFTSGLKTLYQSPTEEAVLMALGKFAGVWDEKHPQISKGWRAHWENLNTFLGYPADKRRPAQVRTVGDAEVPGAAGAHQDARSDRMDGAGGHVVRKPGDEVQVVRSNHHLKYHPLRYRLSGRWVRVCPVSHGESAVTQGKPSPGTDGAR